MRISRTISAKLIPKGATKSLSWKPPVRSLDYGVNPQLKDESNKANDLPAGEGHHPTSGQPADHVPWYRQVNKRRAVVGGALIGAVVAVAGAPLVIAAVGFGAGGIVAGSYAASMMSAAALANGGGVAAGSLVAVLQSIGAAGFSAAGLLGIGATGATVVGAAVGTSTSKSTREGGIGSHGPIGK